MANKERCVRCTSITRYFVRAVIVFLAIASNPLDSALADGDSNNKKLPDGTPETEKQQSEQPDNEYLLSTPQILNVLKPLEKVTVTANRLSVRASVVTVADPLETRLGRAFDVQLSSLIRAFHSQGFVLDSFALTWKPFVSGSADTGKRILDIGTRQFKDNHRKRPSVLVFRKDLWRVRDKKEPKDKHVDYRVVFLVGESPTFGLHPKAFQIAVKCAARLNSVANNLKLFTKPCYEAEGNENVGSENKKANNKNTEPEAMLRIIGPSFSGSMESLAAAIGGVLRETPTLRIDVVSPSATVNSNDLVADALEDVHGRNTAKIRFAYESLAVNLLDQVRELCDYANDNEINNGSKIVVFAEESTFGRGVIDLLNGQLKEVGESRGDGNTEKSQSGRSILNIPVGPFLVLLTTNNGSGFNIDNDKKMKQIKECFQRIRVVSFPQNVSAIRAEHSREDQQISDSWLGMLRLRRRLLELDFSSFDESTDRPPAYLRKISSRSDELMLYHLFDALRVWVKPVIVAIVATDVRDRLFMLNEVRKSLPASLPVLMEMDYLTVHPDYRKISRGSLVIPNGPTLLCLDNTNWRLADCSIREIRKSYFSFPADYAANMFRAVYCLLRKQEGLNDKICSDIEQIDKTENLEKANKIRKKSGKKPREWDAPRNSAPRVTTLAGFQMVGGKQRSSLLAADSRLTLQWLFMGSLILATLLLLVVTLPLLIARRTNLVMVSSLRGVPQVLCAVPQVLRGVPQWLRGVPQWLRGVRQWFWRDQWAMKFLQGKSVEKVLACTTWFPWLLLGLVGILFLIETIDVRILFFSEYRPTRWSLAHGRDILALGGLFLLYLWIAIRGGWRIHCLTQRHNALYDALRCSDSKKLQDKLSRYRWATVPVSIVILGVITALTLWFGNNQRWPTTVDSIWLPLLMNCVLLASSMVFLTLFYFRGKCWLAMAMYLARTIHVVNGHLLSRVKEVTPGVEPPRWPSPMLLDQSVRSPFGLPFRVQDLEIIEADSRDDQWAEQTREIIHGQVPPFTEAGCAELRHWQERLVAEMRYASAGVRSSAWCGILAPIILLVSMSVYPPIGERMVTTAAVTLIVAGFALVMFVALKVEQNTLLSLMFTQHGNSGSFGGVVGALWPKLLAVTLILIPVLFPGSLEWIFNLLKSINSLQ